MSDLFTANRRAWLLAAALVLAALPALAAEEKAAAPNPGQDPASCANYLWSVTDVVLDRHFEPSARQEMLLSATRALLKAAKADPPHDLSRRVSAITTREQFTDLLREVWPKTPDAEKADGKKLGAAMLDGLLAGIGGKGELVPALMPAQDRKIMEQISGNRYVGIGIQIRVHAEEKRAQIVLPIKSGPARKVGIKPGDVILQVDGKDTHDVSLSKVVEWLRGEEGTAVTVVVRQPGETEARTYKMTRTVVPFETVYGYRRGSGDSWDYRIDPAGPVGYVWVRTLNSATLHDLRQAERRMQAAGLRALVLDLRSSHGGGMLQHAELFADGLLDGGLMWSVRHRGGPAQEFRADRECVFRDWPLAVLIDETVSDNAQGAVIAALRDNGRAVLVGEPTHNTGQVRSLVPLPDGQQVILPTGRLERAAKGKEWPLEPDHRVALSAAQREAVEQWRRDKDLPELPPGTEDKPPADPQLAKAVEVLRAALEKASPADKQGQKK
jgi:carboxyl-terminal processing protease